MTRRRHIVALGGGGFQMEPESPLLDDYVLSLAGKPRPRIAFLGTASGDRPELLATFLRLFSPARCEASVLPLFRREHADLRAFVLSQDVLYVGGGNTLNLLAIWRAHGLAPILREAWEAGVVLAGVSAGGLCWFEGGVTDSFGPSLAPLRDGLGLLGGSFCPHYRNEPGRVEAFDRALSEGLLGGYGVDDGVALHFQGGALHAVVSSRPEGRAFRLDAERGAITRRELPTHLLGPGGAR